MSFDPYELDRDYGAQRRVVTEAEYTARTFLWMVLGLLITFGVATALWLTNLTLYALAAFPVLPVVLLVVTLVLSVTMAARIERMSVGTARSISRPSPPSLALPCPRSSTCTT